MTGMCLAPSLGLLQDQKLIFGHIERMCQWRGRSLPSQGTVVLFMLPPALEFTQYMFFASLFLLAFYFLWKVLQYTRIEYGITTKRLLMKRGIFRVGVTEILINRMKITVSVQGFFGVFSIME